MRFECQAVKQHAKSSKRPGARTSGLVLWRLLLCNVCVSTGAIACLLACNFELMTAFLITLLATWPTRLRPIFFQSSSLVCQKFRAAVPQTSIRKRQCPLLSYIRRTASGTTTDSPQPTHTFSFLSSINNTKSWSDFSLITASDFTHTMVLSLYRTWPWEGSSRPETLLLHQPNQPHSNSTPGTLFRFNAISFNANF